MPIEATIGYPERVVRAIGHPVTWIGWLIARLDHGLNREDLSGASRRLLGVEFDFGYSPDFFGNGLNSYVLTTMGNVIVGIPFDGTRSSGIRPYATGGIFRSAFA